MMPNLKIKIILPFLAAAFLMCSNAYAELYTFCLDHDCTGASVWLDSIYTAKDYTDDDEVLTTLLTGTGIPAQLCVGVWDGNTKEGNTASDFNAKPTGLNIGLADDGLLNSQYREWVDSNSNGEMDEGELILRTNYFFTDASHLFDLGGDDGLNDPGWIYLYKNDKEGSDTGYATVGPIDATSETINISDYLTITVTYDGNNAGSWTLQTFEGIVEDIQAALNRATFSDLAIAFKLGDYYVAYDFDFQTIFANYLKSGVIDPEDLFTTAFVFEGGFNLNKDSLHLNGNGTKYVSAGISHVDFWALDPPGGGEPPAVPEPATMILMGMGMIGLAGISRKKIKRE